MIRRTRVAAAATVALAAVAAPDVGARSLAERTFTVSLGVNGTDANGASTRPAITSNGRVVAFESVATNLTLDGNGAVRDVFARDLLAQTTELVSEGPGGAPADGASSRPVVGGPLVAFQSDATNLVPGDANGTTDVFARGPTGGVVRVSVAADGGDAVGASTRPDVSADGARIAFVSTAPNLVPGDTNGHADVFVRDLRTGVTTRVSQAAGGEANGPSGAPAISPDGRYVAFSSAASNLVPRDTNGVHDVFLADLRDGSVERVSVSTRGRQQNRSVIAPFVQVADVSRGARIVAFDSDATNLAPGDRNRDTDVFLRLRDSDRTVRLSVNKFGFESDNDSFNPVITPNGRFIAFQSFATQLAAGDGPREDVFMYDLGTFAPVTISVGHRGQTRDRERVRQLLQRPAVSDSGNVVAFTSTAGNLVSGDRNGVEDVFVRVTAPPRVRIVRGPRGVISQRRPRLLLRADDRRVREFICTIDRVRVRCGRNSRLPALAPGPHVLLVQAGGPGMLYQRRPLVRRFTVRR